MGLPWYSNCCPCFSQMQSHDASIKPNFESNDLNQTTILLPMVSSSSNKPTFTCLSF